jgi:hypothetical protein
MNAVRRLAIVVVAWVSLGIATSVAAAPWSASGYVRQAAGTNSKILAIALVVIDEEGGPVTGLEPANFAVDYLVPTPTTSLFFRAEMSVQRPDGFAEHAPGLYVMYVTTTHSAALIRGVSIRVLKPEAPGVNGGVPKVQKTAVFVPKSG